PVVLIRGLACGGSQLSPLEFPNAKPAKTKEADRHKDRPFPSRSAQLPINEKTPSKPEQADHPPKNHREVNKEFVNFSNRVEITMEGAHAQAPS
ncbi:MAG: hypothetical protein CMO76_09550, partial [Verrucomicrobiales bacterium]|nr:hypothetical protein [Verrucomicrobiales bacterium]